METAPWLKIVSESDQEIHIRKVVSDRLVKVGIVPANPDLQDEWFIHYTTAAPTKLGTEL